MADIGGPEVEKMALELANYAGQGGYVARREAQTVLGRMGVKAAVPILMKNYDNVDMSQSAYTLNALERIGDRRMLQALTNMTTQAGFMKQCTGGQGSEKQCKKHESAIRKTRLDTLSRLGTKETLAMVKEILEVEKPKSTKLQKAAEAAKGRLLANEACDGKDLVCWMDQLKAKNPRTREKAAYELMWRQDPTSIDALVGQLGDEDNEARFPAIMALWRMISIRTTIKSWHTSTASWRKRRPNSVRAHQRRPQASPHQTGARLPGAALKFFHYPKCGTCKRPRMVEEPRTRGRCDRHRGCPTDEGAAQEILEISGLPLQKFFNTSGQSYRNGNFKEKLKSMSDDEALNALAADGSSSNGHFCEPGSGFGRL